MTPPFHKPLSKPRALPPFQQMWNNYPKGKPDEVATAIGGKVKDSVLPTLGTPNAWNTCTIRLSQSFNHAGDPIPKRHILKNAPDKHPMATVPGADHMQYAYRVKDMDYYLRETYGPPAGTVHLKQGESLASVLPPEKLLLIIYFKERDPGTGKESSASHADLWDGKGIRYNDVSTIPHADSFEIKYWELY